MASASKIIIALLFLLLIGIVWAALYEIIYVQQPATNPYVIATDGEPGISYYGFGDLTL